MKTMKFTYDNNDNFFFVIKLQHFETQLEQKVFHVCLFVTFDVYIHKLSNDNCFQFNCIIFVFSLLI